MPVSLERKDSLERSQGGNVIRNDMPPLKLNPNRQKDVKPFPACDKLHIEMLPRKKTTQSNDIASFSCFYLWNLWGMVEMTQMPRPLALHQWTAQQRES